MNLASLQTITWGTVTAAVCSALLLASVSAERPAAARHSPRPTHQAARDNAQALAPRLAEAMPIATVSAEPVVKP